MFTFYMMITILLIILGLCANNRKIIAFIQIIWIWMIMAFSNGGSDYSGHLAIFHFSQNRTFSGVFEIVAPDNLYKYLCTLAGKAGLDFYHFNMICTTIALLGLFYIILKECKKPSVALSFYMLYPLADSVIQKRFFLSSIVVLFALNVLRDKKKLFWLKYLILCLIAMGLHSSALFYIVLLPLDFVTYKALKKWIAIILSAIILGISFIPLIVDRLFGGGSIKVYTYFINTSMRLDSSYKVLVFILVQAIFLVLHYFLFKDENDKFDFYRKLDFSMIVVMPLYFYNSTFLRFYRNILPLYYIKVADKFNNNHRYKCSMLIKLTVYFFYIVWMFLFNYVLFGNLGVEVLVKGLFEYNAILGPNM